MIIKMIIIIINSIYIAHFTNLRTRHKVEDKKRANTLKKHSEQ